MVADKIHGSQFVLFQVGSEVKKLIDDVHGGGLVRSSTCYEWLVKFRRLGQQWTTRI